jgi:pimeloyl-ACP methyl ester carboxylesterase
VIFQLDPTYAGLQEFDRTVGLVSAHEDDGTWPEAIVVGLDYENPYDRERDYTPTEPLVEDFSNPDGADRFYAALRDDVLPYVDGALPVDPAFRVLQGHSKGGVFSWYAALRHRDGVPPLFAAHVAADAGIGEVLFTLERWHAEQATDLPLRIYATRAELNGPIQQVAFDGLIGRLEDRAYAGLSLKTAVLETDHAGAVTPSFEQGLDFAFEEAP